jgi:hypothetical protein
VFNDVVGGVHNEVVGGVWRRRPDVRPDVLLRLFSELNESAHASACSIELFRRSPGPGHQIAREAFASVALGIHFRKINMCKGIRESVRSVRRGPPCVRTS